MTKDNLTKEFIKLVKNNTKAMDHIANAVETINDNNVLHIKSDTERYETIKILVASVKSSNKVMTWVIILFSFTILALMFLAGFEKLDLLLPFVNIFK
jgi:hypothetical protein